VIDSPTNAHSRNKLLIPKSNRSTCSKHETTILQNTQPDIKMRRLHVQGKQMTELDDHLGSVIINNRSTEGCAS